MIRRSQDKATAQKKMFDAPGEVIFNQILNPGEFHGTGRIFSHVVLKPGCGLGSHTHQGDFEIYYVLKGEAAYDDNGTMTTLKPGDVAICEDGETHSVLNEGDVDFEFVAVVLFTKK